MKKCKKKNNNNNNLVPVVNESGGIFGSEIRRSSGGRGSIGRVRVRRWGRRLVDEGRSCSSMERRRRRRIIIDTEWTDLSSRKPCSLFVTPLQLQQHISSSTVAKLVVVWERRRRSRSSRSRIVIVVVNTMIIVIGIVVFLWRRRLRWGSESEAALNSVGSG